MNQKMEESSYFPYRAHKNRPYLAEFLALPDKERSWDTLMHMSLSRTRQAFGDRDTIDADAELSQLVHASCMNESGFSSELADFFGGGQVVFHISRLLRDAFKNSDLGDATARDLKFPFPHSYIHIGIDAGLVFNGGLTQLEGVLLSDRKHKDGNAVGMTLVGTLVTKPEHWRERAMETFTFHFSASEMDMPILGAAKKHLEHEALDPNEDANLANLSEFDEKARKGIQDSWASQAKVRRLNEENIPVVLECVRMVANALLYVSQYPDDLADDYQDGFPAVFREKIEHSEGKARERNLSKARNNGFTVIKRVGHIFENAMRIEASANGGGDGPSPHLRRAHWRRQAYGAGLIHRKLIWIRAARVLGGTARDRPYLVTSDPTVVSNDQGTGTTVVAENPNQ